MDLPFAITICGLTELRQHARARVSHVLSILDPEFPEPAVFADYGAHAKLELRFDDIIEERAAQRAPQSGDIEALLGFGRSLDAEAGAHLLVHCHMGISRSTASTALLLAQKCPAAPADEIFTQLLALRPQIWPNLRMLEMGDQILGRQGALVAGAAKLYRVQIERDPQWIDEMRAHGRSREIDLAYS